MVRKIVAGDVLRGGTRFSPFFLLVGLLVFSVAAMASGDATEDPESSLWMIWGAAALQVTLSMVGGVLVYQLKRSFDLNEARLTALEKRLEKTDDTLTNLRIKAAERTEVQEEMKEVRTEIRGDIKDLQATVADVKSDGTRLDEKMDKILRLLGATNV